VKTLHSFSRNTLQFHEIITEIQLCQLLAEDLKWEIKGRLEVTILYSSDYSQRQML